MWAKLDTAPEQSLEKPWLAGPKQLMPNLLMSSVARGFQSRPGSTVPQGITALHEFRQLSPNARVLNIERGNIAAAMMMIEQAIHSKFFR